MRVIVKPGGLVVIGTIFVLLTGVSLRGAHPLNPSQADAAPSIKQELIPTVDITSNRWDIYLDPKMATQEVVPCSLPGFSRARKFTTVRNQPDVFVQFLQTVPAPIAKGTRLRIRLWARSARPAPVDLVFEQKESPFTRVYTRRCQLLPHWQEFSDTFIVDHDIPANSMKIDIQSPMNVNEQEITGLSLGIVE